MGCNILQNEVCHIPDKTKHLLVKADIKMNQDKTKGKIDSSFVDCYGDIDFVCYMLNNSKKISDTICYQNMIGHGIKLSESDAEMHIDLDNIESNIHCLMFCLCIFAPQKEYKKLGKESETMIDIMQNAVLRIYDEDTNKEICRFVLTNKKETTAVYIGNLKRTSSDWQFKAIEENLNGDIVGIKTIITNSQHLDKF